MIQRLFFFAWPGWEYNFKSPIFAPIAYMQCCMTALERRPFIFIILLAGAIGFECSAAGGMAGGGSLSILLVCRQFYLSISSILSTLLLILICWLVNLKLVYHNPLNMKSTIFVCLKSVF